MGRGLSTEQRAILGLACAVNRATQGGELRVKTGKPVDGYRIPTIDWRGPPDLSLRLAMWAIGGYLPDPNTHEYRHTPQLKSLKSSLSRAMTRLVNRGLIVYTDLPVDSHGYLLSPLGHDYVLTEAGIGAGADHESQHKQLDVALQAFGMVLPGPEIRAKWPKDNLLWQHYRMKAEAIGKLYHGGNQSPSPIGSLHGGDARSSTNSPNGYRPSETIDHQLIDVMVDEVPTPDRVNRYADNEVSDVVPVDEVGCGDCINRYREPDGRPS